jgi:hypothetical protein
METKFIVTKDGKHFKSQTCDHYLIARDNGYDIKSIVETGMIVDSRLVVFECYNGQHLQKIKHTDKFIQNDINNFLEELTNRRILKAREVESMYMYKTERQGD